MADQRADDVAVTYRIIRFGEAAEMGAPIPRWEASWEDALAYDGDWNSGVWRCENGVPVEFIGQDGGEPEDQTLRRDWAWVASALQAAYDFGKRHNDGEDGRG